MNETQAAPAKSKSGSIKVTTPIGRVSFPTVFEPKSIDGKQEPKYSCTLIFDKAAQATPEFAALKAAVRQAAVAKWGPDTKAWPKDLVNPIKDGAEKKQDGYGPGTVFINMSAKLGYRPLVIDGAKRDITSPNEFYGGCYGRAIINVYAYPKKENPLFKKGVGFGLLGVQKYKDGDPFGNKMTADDFEAIEPGAEGGSQAEPAADATDPLA